MNATVLYRPVGLRELALILEADWRAFPPRLDWQPLFYPVLNEPYAAQIARDWNTADAGSGYFGAVTRFEVDAALVATYPVQNVGAAGHDELWVPAAALPAFNDHLTGPIVITQVFFGPAYQPPQNPVLAHLLQTWHANFITPTNG